MMGSYDSEHTMVRYLSFGACLGRLGALVIAGLLLGVVPTSAQTPAGAPTATPPASPAVTIPPGGPNIRLQLRVFDGLTEVTRDTRVRLFPAGRRNSPIRLTLGADRAYEAEVPVGLYDVQAIRSRSDSIAGVRWVERMLVQQYPDEYGRHLQVVNLRDGFGALQIRPENGRVSPPGWSAIATPPGVRTTESAKARPLGPDLLLVVPAGTYDIKVMLPSEEPAWITALDIPDQRTRLKTWPLK